MEEERHTIEVPDEKIHNQETYKYPSLWTCVKSTLWYTVQLFNKFFRSIFVGLAFTSLIDFVVFTAITAKRLAKGNGGSP